MAKETIPADIRKMSFEEALGELEAIVRKLEEGRGELDGAIKSYERGAALKQYCESKLKEAQMKVEKIVLGPDGDVSVGEVGAEKTDIG